MTRALIILLIPVVVLIGCGPPTLQGELVLKDGKWVRMPPPAPGTPAFEVAVIRHHVRKDNNRRAITAAEEFLEEHPDDDGREEVMMLAAQAWMNRDRYMKAYEWYEKVLGEDRTGDHFEKALRREYEIAEAFLAGKKQLVLGFLHLSAEAEALDILSKIAGHAPGSALAEDALLGIGDYHLQEQSYAEAAGAYDEYLELFGKSARARYARYRAAVATFSLFRDIPYDDTPLVEADLRFRTFARSYPRSAERAGVWEALDRIAELRAHKDYDTAQFYERIQRPKAAAFYYREIMTRYKRTPWSPRADAALARLKHTRGAED